LSVYEYKDFFPEFLDFFSLASSRILLSGRCTLLAELAILWRGYHRLILGLIFGLTNHAN